MQQAHERALAPTNLEQLLEDVSKATWVRKKRTDLVTADAGTPKDGIPPTPAPLVKLILELEHRSSWMAMTDSGAFKRVLLNLLGNSLKFTKQGHVKLALREMTGRAADPKKSMVRLEIEDTGCGMSEHFLRTKLFVPFVQE